MIDIVKQIKAFKESTLTDSSRFPGYSYALTLGNSIDIFNELRLTLQYDLLSRMNYDTTMEAADIEYSLNKIRNRLNELYLKNNTIKWPYIEAPFFTDTEARKLRNYYLEHHRTAGEHYSNIHNVDSKTYRNRVQEIQELIKQTEDPEEISRLKNELIAIGWNPEIEYNIEAVVKAKDRIVKKYNKELNEFFFIDCSDIVSVWSESTSDHNNNAVFIIAYENGNVDVQCGSLILDENNIEFADIYAFYIDEASEIDTSKFKYTSEEIFTLPSNLRAARVIKKIYAEFGIFIGGYRPIIKKFYSGSLKEANVNNINKYAAYVKHAGYPNSLINEGYVDFTTYISDNIF